MKCKYQKHLMEQRQISIVWCALIFTYWNYLSSMQIWFKGIHFTRKYLKYLTSPWSQLDLSLRQLHTINYLSNQELFRLWITHWVSSSFAWEFMTSILFSMKRKRNLLRRSFCRVWLWLLVKVLRFMKILMSSCFLLCRLLKEI